MLEARSLVKYYNHTAVVRGVSFTIRPGEILGYLGSNGAGKSTTVKILTGLLQPSEGQIFYNGHSVHEDFTSYQRRIGYVPEEAHLYPTLSGWEYLQLVGRLRGTPARILEPKIDEFLRAFSLWDDRHEPLSAYSKGMRQKILLSAALLHNPDILILDEPFSGLDVTAALMVRSLLAKLAGQGKIILFSSHVLEVVEKVCTNVLILRQGEVVAYDSIDRLRSLMSQPSLEGVFAQLAETQDSESRAGRIIDVMTGEPDPPPPAAIEKAPAKPLAGLGRDLRFGLRTLRASPVFTLVALLSLSLGIAIATCAFSEMNGMALRAVPMVDHPGELVALQSPVSFPAFQRYSQQTGIFSASMAYAAPVPFAINLNGNTERVWGQLASASYFSTLGARPLLGSFFPAADDILPRAPAVVVSYRFWRERLAADPAVAGRALRVNGKPCTILGVAPDGFLGASPFLFPADLWMHVSAGGGVAPELAGNALESRAARMFFMVGRLRAGIAAAGAESQLDGVARRFDDEQTDRNPVRAGRRILFVAGGKLFPLRKQDLPFFTTFLTAMAVLIMLIACANVATMALARAAGRRREIAVRLALGASRWRLIRQLLTESIAVALPAGLIGFAVSRWLMSLSSQIRMPYPMPVAFDFRPDIGVFALTLLLSLFTGVAFGLVPALQATRPDLAPSLKEGAGVFLAGHRRFNVRNVLMVTQVSVSLTLLVVLGLLSIGIQSTLGIQAGFDSRNLYAISVDPVRDGYSGARAHDVMEKLLDRVKRSPSIAAAALTETVPVSMPGAGVAVSTPGATERRIVQAVKHTVGRDYFAATGIAILSGRAFRREDETGDAKSVIITEALSRELFGGAQSVGRILEIGNSELAAAKILPGSFDHRPTVAGNGAETVEVAGVAANVSEGLTVGKPRPAIYFPMGPSSYARPPLQGITLLARASPGANALAAVRREITNIDPQLTPFNARSMKEQIEQFMSPLRAAAWTYGIIGIFGVVLSAVGLAGVTAQSVAQRKREIGIRMALGAENRDVLSLVMREGLALVGAGTVAGMAGAWIASRLLAAMNASVGTVSSTSTSDPRVLYGAPLLLALVAAFACYLPARKSVSVDPATVLRQN